jgi:hypothetical protein
MLKLVAGTHDAEGRFFFGRIKGPPLLEFVLQFWHGHGLVQACLIYLHLVYISIIGMSSHFRDISENGRWQAWATCHRAMPALPPRAPLL